MKKLSADHRGRLAEKVIDLGNLLFVGIIIAQFVPIININPITVFLAIIFIFSAYGLGVILMKRNML